MLFSKHWKWAPCSHCLNEHLGQDLDFGGFVFALKLPEWLNTNLVTVRAKLRQTSSFPNGPRICMVPNRAMNLGAQLGPMSITKLSPIIGLVKWAPVIAQNLCCLGRSFRLMMPPIRIFYVRLRFATI